MKLGDKSVVYKTEINFPEAGKYTASFMWSIVNPTDTGLAALSVTYGSEEEVYYIIGDGVQTNEKTLHFINGTKLEITFKEQEMFAAFAANSMFSNFQISQVPQQNFIYNGRFLRPQIEFGKDELKVQLLPGFKFDKGPDVTLIRGYTLNSGWGSDDVVINVEARTFSAVVGLISGNYTFTADWAAHEKQDAALSQIVFVVDYAASPVLTAPDYTIQTYKSEHAVYGNQITIKVTGDFKGAPKTNYAHFTNLILQRNSVASSIVNGDFKDAALPSGLRKAFVSEIEGWNLIGLGLIGYASDFNSNWMIGVYGVRTGTSEGFVLSQRFSLLGTGYYRYEFSWSAVQGAPLDQTLLTAVIDSRVVLNDKNPDSEAVQLFSSSYHHEASHAFVSFTSKFRNENSGAVIGLIQFYKMRDSNLIANGDFSEPSVGTRTDLSYVPSWMTTKIVSLMPGSDHNPEWPANTQVLTFDVNKAFGSITQAFNLSYDASTYIFSFDYARNKAQTDNNKNQLSYRINDAKPKTIKTKNAKVHTETIELKLAGKFKVEMTGAGTPNGRSVAISNVKLVKK